MNRPASTVLLVALGLCLTAFAQQASHHFPTPPETMDPDGHSDQQSPVLHRNVNLLQIQHEANELARTAGTIPSDVDNIRRGMLPKDTIEKLKQIEKLSKRLRSELNP